MDKFFKDKHGHWAIWQTPNTLLVIWFLAMIAVKLLPAGRIDSATDLIAFGSLFAWAWLEVSKGDSYFRRVLGALVLVVIVIGRSK